MLGLICVGLVVIYLLGFYFIPKILVSISKATGVSKISVSNSYIIGAKILAKADGVDKCVVNVFLADKEGKGIPGRRVILNGVEDIRPVKSGVTDGVGMASFEVVSKTEGSFKLSATVDGVPLGKELTVIFREE